MESPGTRIHDAEADADPKVDANPAAVPRRAIR
jgi:hypothetical protein